MTIVETIRNGKETSEKANFVNLVAVALADGHITHEEYDLLYIVGKRFGASHDEVDEIISAYKLFTFEVPTVETEKYKQFISLIRMMLADGVVDESEIKLINGFSTHLGFDQALTNRLVKQITDMVLQDHLDDEILAAIK